MIKQSIRIAGFILALFALILVFKHTHMMQEEKPLGKVKYNSPDALSTIVNNAFNNMYAKAE